MEVTINLPKEVTFKRAGVVVTYALAELPMDMIAALCEHGLVQKVGDSAAGKSGEEATSKMDMTYKALAEGEWGVRRVGGGGLSELETEMAVVFALGTKMEFGKGVKKPERVALASEALAGETDEVRAQVEQLATKRIADRKEKAKQEAAELAGLSITVSTK